MDCLASQRIASKQDLHQRAVMVSAALRIPCRLIKGFIVAAPLVRKRHGYTVPNDLTGARHPLLTLRARVLPSEMCSEGGPKYSTAGIETKCQAVTRDNCAVAPLLEFTCILQMPLPLCICARFA